MAKNIPGPEKAAILLMSIGEENAANVMANMDEREIQAVGNYMSALGEIEQETRARRQVEGIDIPQSTWEAIGEVAEEMGVALPTLD